jgi:hypothetical protein
VPDLRFSCDRDNSGQARCGELLALHELRRHLESVAAIVATGDTDLAMSQHTLVRRLRELIAALDRRAPQIARSGERSIAQDAAALKARALQRIAELEGAASSSASSPDVLNV